MARRLLVASGGGGDAIAAAMLGSQLSADGGVHIATYSWDRLIIDPLPGPRAASDFVGLEPMGQWNYRVTPTTTLRPPAASTLPRLTAELRSGLYLLDPHRGVVGLKQQLGELVELLAIDAVDLIDVGGDILASGDEPTLKSPLGDSLTLAAVQGLGPGTRVLVAGPGLDGELTEVEVLERCRQLAGDTLPITLAADAARQHGPLFEWHVSEASGLFHAAALGVRGTVEIRDHGMPVVISSRSAQVWSLNSHSVLSVNRIAQRLLRTNSLHQAEAVLLAAGCPSELEYERTKATRVTVPRKASTVVQTIDEKLGDVEAAAAGRGADFVTLRRLAELLNLSAPHMPAMRAFLQARASKRYFPPLWALHPSAASSLPSTNRVREVEPL